MARPKFTIISTLGPASTTSEFIQACARVEQTSFRLNGSHLSLAGMRTQHRLLEQTLGPSGWELCLDLCGDKQRIGKLPRDLPLTAGETLDIACTAEAEPGVLPLPAPELLASAAVGDLLVLQDGEAILQVTARTESTLRARVDLAGTVRSGCGIHLRGREPQNLATKPETLAPKMPTNAQQQQVELAAQLGIHALALSYLSRVEQLAELRRNCQSLGYRPRLIAKLERPEAFGELAEICDAADALWLCRGDLGSLVALRELGNWQHRAVAAAKRADKPILIAGQVMHHMTEHRNPTRSEVVHFYDIQRSGTQGIVLSDETAIGKHPIHVIETVTSLLLG